MWWTGLSAFPLVLLERNRSDDKSFDGQTCFPNAAGSRGGPHLACRAIPGGAEYCREFSFRKCQNSTRGADLFSFGVVNIFLIGAGDRPELVSRRSRFKSARISERIQPHFIGVADPGFPSSPPRFGESGLPERSPYCAPPPAPPQFRRSDRAAASKYIAIGAVLRDGIA